MLAISAQPVQEFSQLRGVLRPCAEGSADCLLGCEHGLDDDRHLLSLGQVEVAFHLDGSSVDDPADCRGGIGHRFLLLFMVRVPHIVYVEMPFPASRDHDG